MSGIGTHNFRGADYTGSCKSNYYTIMTAPHFFFAYSNYSINEFVYKFVDVFHFEYIANVAVLLFYFV
jgi:hypothetical protein